MSAVYATVCQRPSIHHLRPSATVAAWQPGPAAPVRGKASIPPGVVSTGSGASVRRDLPGFASACVHPCPENGASPTVFARSIGVTRPGFVPRRTGSRLCCSQLKQTANEAATAPETSGGGRCPIGATSFIAKLPAVASAITRFELNRCAVAGTLLQPILHFRLLL